MTGLKLILIAFYWRILYIVSISQQKNSLWLFKLNKGDAEYIAEIRKRKGIYKIDESVCVQVQVKFVVCKCTNAVVPQTKRGNSCYVSMFC